MIDLAVGMIEALNMMVELSFHLRGYSLPLLVVTRLGIPPLAFITHTSMLPSRLEAKAMWLPSGLHTG